MAVKFTGGFVTEGRPGFHGFTVRGYTYNPHPWMLWANTTETRTGLDFPTTAVASVDLILPSNAWYTSAEPEFNTRFGNAVATSAIYDNSNDSTASVWFDSYDGQSNQTRNGNPIPTNALYETGVNFAPSVWFDSYDGSSNQTRTAQTYPSSAVQAN